MHSLTRLYGSAHRLFDFCDPTGSKLYIFGGLTPVGRDANVTALQDCWVLETGIETGGAAGDASA
jgi:hypothetical protein